MNNVVKIIKGEVKSIELRIRDSITKDPVDLTNKVLSANLKGCPTPVALVAEDFTVVAATLGKLKMNLSAVHTNALKEGVISFEVILTEGASVRKVRFDNTLEVVGAV